MTGIPWPRHAHGDWRHNPKTCGDCELLERFDQFAATVHDYFEQRFTTLERDLQHIMSATDPLQPIENAQSEAINALSTDQQQFITNVSAMIAKLQAGQTVPPADLQQLQSQTQQIQQMDQQVRNANQTLGQTPPATS